MYEEMCMNQADWLIHELPKTGDNGFQHVTSGIGDRNGVILNEGQLWVDTLFMAVLFLQQMGNRYNNPGFHIGVIGTIPLSLRREYLVCLCNIIDVIQLALAVKNVQGMLCKTCGCGISVRISPCSKVVGTALFNDSGLNLGKNLIKITSLSSQINTQCSAEYLSVRIPPARGL